ncbi:hypothetical protein PYW07_003805 [Mythimna separata]|uniref:C-type lectin domain-containing protein n=1 Tax=Mythimna separata TaxID=271217 RepID=A0AAD8DTQ8_MYTSE|nr:hypothetical protein PYW07_003805 [Mythimna separata]
MPNLDYTYNKDNGKFNEGWQTVKGTRMNVDREAWFDNYQPDGDSNGECGSMFFNGRLINTACEMKSFFICEHDVDDSSAIANASVSDTSRVVLQPYFGGGSE